MKLLLVAVAGFILSASTAFAQLPADIEAFQKKLLQKYTVDDIFGDKPKSLCVCKDSTNYNAVGVLASYSGGGDKILVFCAVLRALSGDGVINSYFSCDDWVPLAK